MVIIEKINRIKQLINELNKASDAYYNSTPIMTDYDWDKLYEELKALEEETNVIYPDSPTQNVGYKVLDEIKEVKHNHPMLSLDKCHSEQELIDFAKDKDCILSVKADGLTTSLHYINGQLIGAETRGNGISGSDVLENVLNIKNVPHIIPYKDELIIDGETIIDWNTFNKINENLPVGQDKYKHPRNLVSGTITMLDTNIAASRNMRFIAWRVIKGLDEKSVYFGLKEAEKLGFEIIPMWTYTNKSMDKENLSAMLSELQDKANELDIPYDGAVMAYDDIEYGNSLGRTDKFFRHSISYKYEDELYETTLRNIEWNASKTGLVNPVAVFDETVIDGTGITRATLHNISYIENLQLGFGDKIRIYKANKIIPKVHDNLTRSNTWELPNKCPNCGGNVEVHNENGSKTLHCINDNCSAKLLGKLVHFCSKNAINIEGMSEATLQFLIDKGWVKSFQDIYKLDYYRQNWKEYDGFGDKSVDKLLDAVENSRKTTLDRFIYSLSIPQIGRSASKDIAKFFNNNYEEFKMYGITINYTQIDVDGFGESMNNSLHKWLSENRIMIKELAKEFTFKKEKNNSSSVDLSGKIFVITGSLIHYKNRDELVSIIESMGGKVSGSVSAKTSFLINNDTESNSSKNKKAKQLGIPILSEQDFINMIS